MFSDRSEFPDFTVTEYAGERTDVLIAGHTNPWVEVDGKPVDWTDAPLPPRPGSTCDGCAGEPIPGVATAMDDRDGIQRCDSCALFAGDLDAAKALADLLGGRVFFYRER
jgi:hypothetical protein